MDGNSNLEKVRTKSRRRKENLFIFGEATGVNVGDITKDRHN